MKAVVRLPNRLGLPPHSVEAEQSVLGALLLDNRVFGDVADLITEAEFYRDDHRRIFRHIVRLIGEGTRADVVTVCESIERASETEQCGGLAYLGEIANNCPSSSVALHYARIVHRCHAQREALAAMQDAEAAIRAGGDFRPALQAVYEALPVQAARVAAPIVWARLEPRTPPDRQWVIDDWLGTGHTTLLAGRGGIGKTLLAQAIGSAVAIAHRYLGAVRQARNVLMWACEDDHDELWRRQCAIAGYFGESIGAFGALTIVPRVGLDNALLSSEFGRPLWTPLALQLEEQVCDLKAEVLIIDNTGQCFGGAENDRHHVTTFVNRLNGIGGAANLATATLLLTHPGRAHGSEFSGSSAWENCCRMRWYLGDRLPDQPGNDEPSGAEERYLCKRKTNYSVRDWLRLIYHRGMYVPDTPAEASTMMGEHYRKAQARRLVLDGLRALGAMGKCPSEVANSPDYLPRLLVEFELAEAVSRPMLGAAMRELMVEGRLRRDVVGRYVNRHARYGLVDTAAPKALCPESQ